MGCGERRKCKCCHTLFRPDARNRARQHYRSAPACRAASKAASQARWLAKPENQSYLRGPMHVARVQAWRSCHPAIGAKGGGLAGDGRWVPCKPNFLLPVRVRSRLFRRLLLEKACGGT